MPRRGIQHRGAEGTNLTFKFTSGPAYVLYVLCIIGFAMIKGATFNEVATALTSALIWYTGRRAYKEVKAGQLTMTRNGEVKPENGEQK